jgi:hypothetical protein
MLVAIPIWFLRIAALSLGPCSDMKIDWQGPSL